MERYDEKFVQSKKIRDRQYQQMSDYIARITDEGSLTSEESFHPDFSSIENYAESTRGFREMVQGVIGYPPPHGTTDKPVREEFVAEDDLCTIYRLYIPVDADLDCYGLYLVVWARVLLQRLPPMLVLLAIALAAAQAAWHFTLIRGRSREGCFKAFRLNHWLGFTVFAGVVAGYALR